MIGLLGVVMGCGGGGWTSVVLGCYLAMVVGQRFVDLLVRHWEVRERERDEILINKYKNKEINKIFIYTTIIIVYIYIVTVLIFYFTQLYLYWCGFFWKLNHECVKLYPYTIL